MRAAGTAPSLHLSLSPVIASRKRLPNKDFLIRWLILIVFVAFRGEFSIWNHGNRQFVTVNILIAIKTLFILLCMNYLCIILCMVPTIELRRHLISQLNWTKHKHDVQSVPTVFCLISSIFYFQYYSWYWQLAVHFYFLVIIYLLLEKYAWLTANPLDEEALWEEEEITQVLRSI